MVKRSRARDGGSGESLHHGLHDTKKRRRSLLRVATDFSGIDTPLIALQKLHVPYHHLFSCDNSRVAQKVLKTCHNADTLYRDVRERDVANMAQVDLFVFGWPCQPFSTLGNPILRLQSQ